MSALPPFLRLYLQGTCLYGLAHAIPHAWSHKTRMYRKSYSEEARELLLVDKAGMVAANVMTAPFLWPFLLRYDLIRFECLVRGKPVSEYLPANDDV